MKSVKKAHNKYCRFGTVIGILAIIVGIYFIFSCQDVPFYGIIEGYGTTRLGAAEFGADFYTEIYESTAFAGNAVKGVYELLGKCFGVFMIFAGLVDICVFKLLDSKYSSDLKEKNLDALSAPQPEANDTQANPID